MFTKYVTPLTNIPHERYLFNRRDQHEEETFDQYLTELCPAFYKTCSNCGKQNHIKSKCKSSQQKKSQQINCARYI